MIDDRFEEISYLTGVNTKQSDGSFRLFVQVWGEIFESWNELPDSTQLRIVEIIFGGADLDTSMRMCSIAANAGLTIEEAICNSFEVPCDISRLI